MLKEIIEEKNITAYYLSKKSGIPYSTIADIISGKTEIQFVTAMVLYRLSQALDMTMEQILLYQKKKESMYLYNEGRTIIVFIAGKRLSYLGPKNLIGFHRINKCVGNTLYVDCYFLDKDKQIYTEEDYVDLQELFEEHQCFSLLDKPYEVILGRPTDSKRTLLLNQAFLVSDNLAMVIKDNGTEDIVLEITNVKRNCDRMLLRLKDYAILSTNMSKKMQERATNAAKRNIDIIEEEVEERKKYA